jgi:O-antigen/teichoic acid export membrane protein
MVISAFLGVAANGLIAVAAKFSSIYTTAFSIFNTSWTEQVVLHYKDEGGAEYICNMFDRMVTFFGCIAVGIVACMPFAFNIMVNEKFSEAYNLVPLYMIAVFFNAIIGMISAIYLIENETKRVATSTMVAAAINLLVDIALVRFIGSYAAPISSICGYATISFWRLYDVNKRHCKIGMSLRKVIALLLGLFITMVSYFSPYKIIQIVVLVVVAVGSCLLNKEFLNEFFMLLVSKTKK